MNNLLAAIGAFFATITGAPGHSAGHSHHAHQPTPTPPAIASMQSGSGGTNGTTGSMSGNTTQGTGQAATVTTSLQSMPAGTVDISFDSQTQYVTARLNAFGLTPDSVHQVSLAAANGSAFNEVVFPDVTADGNGRVVQSVTSKFQDRQGLPTAPFFRIDMERTHFADGGETRAIAVADRYTSRDQMGDVTLTFRSTLGQDGGPLNGHATLKYDPKAQTLTVHVTATGLAPGSAHAAHVHSGSCQLQGPVASMLPDLVAGADGTAMVDTTIKNVTSAPPARGWYVNVHEGNMNQILVNGQPTDLFQPVLCGNVGNS